MSIQIFNLMTKEPFIPMEEGKVKCMYVTNCL